MQRQHDQPKGNVILELLTDQAEADAAFRTWVDAMIDGSVFNGLGWIIADSGLAFSNYGHGEPGTVTNEIMLGADANFRNGVVKIVRPKTSQRDKGKLTAIGRADDGRLFILRQGWMKKNALSREVRVNFARLTRLTPVPVTVSGTPSTKDWYVVAELGAAPSAIVESTTRFALACVAARSKAGGGVELEEEDTGHGYGVDENGRVTVVEFPARTAQVVQLQGYVWAALKKHVGAKLRKPTRNGYVVDAVINSENLLIEIKTGVAACDIYEAVGQLSLYPSLIGLKPKLQGVLLIPDNPVLPQTLAAALNAAAIPVYTYTVGGVGKKPKITFAPNFLERCGVRPPGNGRP